MTPRAPVLAMILVLALLAAPAGAQETAVTPAPVQAPAVVPLSVQSPILTVDTDRVFNDSAFGLRVAEEVDSKGAALSAENRLIEADLEAEERALTEQRKTLSAEAFRDLADAFDEKVQLIRATQATKGRAINQFVEQERETFLNAAGPVFEALMREAGAAVILERRSVFVSATAIDITDAAIARLDSTLGRGQD